jgi:hypothetical protein
MPACVWKQFLFQPQLSFFGDLAGLMAPATFRRQLAEVRHVEWIVYAKPPFGGPGQMLTYLGRYTHRVAIANSRLVSLADGRVAFRWKDYRHRGKAKVMTLDAHEFIRRFLLHTLPDGFHRIRHYGFLANGHRAQKVGTVSRPADHHGAREPHRHPAWPAFCNSGQPVLLVRRTDGQVRHLAMWGGAPPSLLERQFMRRSPAGSMAMTELTARRAGLHLFAPRPGARQIRLLTGDRGGRIQRDHRHRAIAVGPTGHPDRVPYAVRPVPVAELTSPTSLHSP